MVQRVCVCGAGTMGRGITQVFARAGFNTICYEPDKTVLEKAGILIRESLDKLIEKNKIHVFEKDRILERIIFTSDFHDCLADLIIEAIVEILEVKNALFSQLSAINRSETIFATNTSSLSVTRIAEAVKNPGRVIGMHFFNPAPVMRLVEIVNTKYTDPETTNLILKIVGQIDKTPVVCKDAPGFIVNRVARPFYLESLRFLEKRISDPAVIDSLLEASGFKMGPFKLMDLIGNDINYAVSCSIYEQLGRPGRLKPSFIQKEKVEKGDLGKKTGKGYYQY